MRVKVFRTAKHNGVTTAFSVKVRGIKFPRGTGNWYFPSDKKPETALKMALNDYENYLVDSFEV